MDAYITLKYINYFNSSKVGDRVTFIENSLQPITFGYLHYVLLGQLALIGYWFFCNVTACRTEKLYCAGYLTQLLVWPILGTVLLTILEYSKIYDEHLGILSENISESVLCRLLHFCYTASATSAAITSLAFLIIHSVSLIDKDPYNGWCLYYLLWIVSSAISYCLYNPFQPQFRRVAGLLVPLIHIIGAAATVLMALLYILMSLACTFRVSMKKYYRPALFTLLLFPTHWHSLYFGARAEIQQLFIEDYKPVDVYNIHQDYPNYFTFTEIFHTIQSTVYIILCIVFFAPFRSPFKAIKSLVCCCKGKDVTLKRGYPVQQDKKPAPAPDPRAHQAQAGAPAPRPPFDRRDTMAPVEESSEASYTKTPL